jgi:hypothetical protein
VRVVCEVSEFLELLLRREEVMGEALSSVLQKGFFNKSSELKFNCGYRVGILCRRMSSGGLIPRKRESQYRNLR